MRRLIYSLRVRIILLIILIMVPAFGYILYMANEEKKQATHHSKEHAMQLVQMVAKDRENNINEIYNHLATLAKYSHIRSGDCNLCKQIIDRFYEQYPYYTAIGIAHTDGNLIYITPPTNEPINISDRSYFRKVLDTRNFSTGEYQIGRVTGKPALQFGYPVLDDSGDVQSVLFAALDLNWLNLQLSREILLPGSNLTIRDSKGKILARFPDKEKWIGKVIPEAPIVNIMLNDGNDEGMAESVGIDGVTRFYAYKKLNNTMDNGDIFLSVGIPKKVAFASVDRMMTRNILALGLLTLVILITAWIGINIFVLRKVNSLLSTTKELASGKMNARTKIPHDAGELGQLASAFDKMAETLEHRDTECKQAEQAIKAAFSELEQIFQATADGLCVIDKDFNILKVNKAYAKLTGISIENSLGKKCYEIFPGPFCHTANCTLARILAGEHFIEYDMDKKRQDGSVISCILTTTPYRNPNGILIGVVENIKNITERKHMEMEMSRYERLNIVGKMAAGIGHEIRNPMTTVRGFLQLLVSKKQCAEFKDYFELMIAELDRANSIITEFLSLARNKPIELKLLNLNNIVETLFPLMQSDAINADKHIKLDLAEIPELLLDDQTIRQLIVNLVRNGLEAMTPGGVLTIKTFTSNKKIVLAVQDQGSGIESEMLPKLGTPFFTTKDNGTGLGLAVCYKIAANHNATIEVESNQEGTTFFVRFQNPE